VTASPARGEKSTRAADLTPLVLVLEPAERRGLAAIARLEAARGGRADLGTTATALLHAAINDRLADLGLRWDPSAEAVEGLLARARKPR
jgi:hypothetical protein